MMEGTRALLKCVLVGVASVLSGCADEISIGGAPYVVATHHRAPAHHGLPVSRKGMTILLHKLPKNADRSKSAAREQEELIQRGLYLRANGHIGVLPAQHPDTNLPATSFNGAAPHYSPNGNLAVQATPAVRLSIP